MLRSRSREEPAKRFERVGGPEGSSAHHLPGDSNTCVDRRTHQRTIFKVRRQRVLVGK